MRHSAGTAASIVNVHVNFLTSRKGADTSPPAPEAAWLRELLRHGHVDEGKVGRRRREEGGKADWTQCDDDDGGMGWPCISNPRDDVTLPPSSFGEIGRRLEVVMHVESGCTEIVNEAKVTIASVHSAVLKV